MEKIIFYLLFLLSFSFCWAQDGDTFYYKGESIRIYGVDCPELNQSLGHEAKMFTQKSLRNAKNIRIERITTDIYGRTIAKVFLDGKDLGLTLIETGNAFVFRRYCNDYSYLGAEKRAKQRKLGVWKYNTQRPWEYRRYNKRR